MARRDLPADEDDADAPNGAHGREDGPGARDEGRGGVRLRGFLAKVATLGGVLRQRHSVFHDTLATLREMELLNEDQAERLTAIWNAGDAAAKGAVEGLVAKVANLEFDRIDVGALKQLGLQKAAETLGPTVEKLQAGDLESFLLRYPDPSAVDAVLDRVTRATLRTQTALVLGGALFAAAAVLAYLFPGFALQYGVPALVLVVGVALWWLAWRIRATLRSLDLDLPALSRLHPHERRAIVVSRLARKTRQAERVKQGLDWLSRNLASTVDTKPGAPPPSGRERS